MATYETLSIDLVANAGALEPGLQKAHGLLAQFQDKLTAATLTQFSTLKSTVLGFVGGLGGGLGLGAVTNLAADMFGLLVKDQEKAKDSTEGLADSLGRLESKLQDMWRDPRAAKGLFAGLEGQKAGGLELNDSVEALVKRLDLVPFASDRARLAMDAFGKKGEEIVKLLDKGGLNAAIELAQKSAGGLSTQTSEDTRGLLSKGRDLFRSSKTVDTEVREGELSAFQKRIIELGGQDIVNIDTDEEGKLTNDAIQQLIKTLPKKKRAARRFAEEQFVFDDDKNVFGQTRQGLTAARTEQTRQLGLDEKFNQFIGAMEQQSQSLERDPAERLRAQIARAGFNDKQSDRIWDEFQKNQQKDLANALDDTIKGLKEEFDVLTMTNDERKRFALERKGASPEQLAEFDTQLQVNREQRAFSKMSDFADALDQQTEAIGKTRNELELLNLARGDEHKGLAALTDLTRARAAVEENEAAQLQERFLSPGDRFNRELGRLMGNNALDGGTRGLAALDLVNKLESAAGGPNRYQAIAGLEAGSREAFSSIFRAEGTPQESAADRVQRVLEQGNQMRKEQLRQGELIIEALRRLPPTQVMR